MSVYRTEDQPIQQFAPPFDPWNARNNGYCSNLIYNNITPPRNNAFRTLVCASSWADTMARPGTTIASATGTASLSAPYIHCTQGKTGAQPRYFMGSRTTRSVPERASWRYTHTHCVNMSIAPGDKVMACKVIMSSPSLTQLAILSCVVSTLRRLVHSLLSSVEFKAERIFHQ